MIEPGDDGPAADRFRAAVKAHMKARKIRQWQLAELLGVAEKHVSQILRGRIRMTFMTAEAITAAVGLEMRVELAPVDRSPDRDSVFVDVAAAAVTMTQTTGRPMHAAVNGKWVLLPDRTRVSVDIESEQL